MKTNGATWNAYLASWPKDQYFDDSDETYDGIHPDEFKGEPKDDTIVEFSYGVVFADHNDREGRDLVRHFSAWLKKQTADVVVCEVPRDKAKDFRKMLRALGGNVRDERSTT